MHKLYTGMLIPLVLLFFNCQTNMSVDPSKIAHTIVNVQFTGFEITDLSINKSRMNPLAFEKIVIEVFEMGQVTDNLTRNQPMCRTEIDIEPGSSTFEGTIEVPAGENRLFIGKLFEKPTQIIPGEQDTLSFISYCGRQAGVKIEIDRLNEVILQLYPVPIHGKRIVLWTWPITIKADKIPPVPIGIATLDTLRGIQFDVDFNPQVLQIQSIEKTPVFDAFSDIYFNYINEIGTRIVTFNQTEQRNILYPVVDLCAEPSSFLNLNLMTVPGQSLNIQKIDLILKNARVSALNYVPLEVFLVPAVISVVAN